jgi:hypothetical protein
MKRECSKHTYKTFKTMIKVNLSYYKFGLEITTWISGRFFKRYNVLAKVFILTM